MKISKPFIGKKLTIIICLALLGNLANAQFFRNYFHLYDEDYYGNTGKLYANSAFKKEGVKEIKTKLVNPKNNEVHEAGLYHINHNGVGFQYLRFNKKGIIKNSYSYHLIDSVHYDKRVSTYKNDTFIEVNIFNNKNQIIEVQYFSKNNKKYSVGKFIYHENGKIASNAWFNHKGKVTSKYEYDFYENGSKKETRYYNKKNKLIRVYSYACEPTGVIEKKVVQQNICKKRTYNPDSSYFEIFEGHDNKGHASRRIVKYSKDSLQLEETFYNKKDKETRRMVYGYQNKKANSIQYFYKSKFKSTTLYTYNEKGFTESYKVTNAKGKVKNNIVYEYSYF